jgi:hypothetical protein
LSNLFARSWESGIEVLVLERPLTALAVALCGLAIASCGGRSALLSIEEGDGGSRSTGPDAGANSGSTTVLLFGGRGQSGEGLGDTWTWDGTSWTEHDVPGPSARYGAAAATLGSTVVLFGGAPGGIPSDDPGNTRWLGDTWVWDGTSWTERHVPGPPARFAASAATLGDTVVLFGGTTETVLGDTWVWDGTRWTEQKVTGPAGRYDAAMATLGSNVVLGYGVGYGIFTDTWLWDGASWTSMDLRGPIARDGASMAPVGGGLVLFGGDAVDLVDTLLGDTWTLSGTAWSQQKVVGPSRRYLASAAALGPSSAVFFGGSNADATAFGDTWTWDGVAWAKQSVAGPSPRWYASMCSVTGP